MQVKQKLRIISIVSVMALLVIFGMLLLTIYRVHKVFEASNIANDIVTASFERLMLRTDSHRTGNERTKEQLIAKHKQVGALLKTALEKFPDPEDKKIVSELLTTHESIGKLSRTIRENREKLGGDAQPDALFLQLEDRLLSQLNMRVYESVLLDGKLQKSGNDALVSALKQTGVGTAFVLLFIGALTLINSWSMGRTIADRVRRLRDSATVIGGGDLDHRIDLEGDDEFVEISAAFNAMTLKLSGSYRVLENEIVERKRSEQALQESEEQFRALADSIPNLAWRANADGYITWYNRRWYEYSGTTPEQMEGWGWQSVHDPNELPRVLERWQASIATGESFEMTFPLRGADGVFRPFLTRGIPLKDAAGRVLQWFGTNTDVSPLKRAEEALREIEERQRMVLQASSIGTFEVDLQTGEGRWNNVEYELLGLEPGDAPGNPERFFQYVHPDDVGLLKGAWEEALRTGELDAEFRIVRADGRECWLAGKGRFLSDGEVKRPLRFLGVNFDITARKQVEKQLKASLAEKEVLLREIHHRVKNNLQVISSLVSLQADSLVDEEMREVLGDVHDRVRTMAMVHEKLYQTDNLANVNFGDYAASLLQYLWRSHGALAEKVQLKLALAPVVLPIEAAVPCGLILNELAGNTLKHAFPHGHGGQVTVGLEFDPATKSVDLWVSDTGVGLTKGLDWRQSRTLGLHLVQILSNQLCGTVEAGVGPGAEFRVTFALKGSYAIAPLI